MYVQASTAPAITSPGFSPDWLVDKLLKGETPLCSDAQLAHCQAHASAACMYRVDEHRISDKELFDFYRQYRARRPDDAPVAWADFMRSQAYSLYNLEYQPSARAASPLLYLPEAVPPPPGTVWAAPAAFAPPDPEPPAPALVPRPTPMLDVDTSQVRSAALRHALDYIAELETAYPGGNMVEQSAQRRELAHRLGIARLGGFRHSPDWPVPGEDGSELINLQDRGAFFAGLRWSGPYTIAAMLGAMLLYRGDNAGDPAGLRASQSLHLLACLRVALVDHDEDIHEHHRTYRALMDGDQHSPDVAPARLIAALRSAYRRNAAEREALMHALASALGVPLDTGRRREAPELYQCISSGFRAQGAPSLPLSTILRALELDLDLTECDQLANLCREQDQAAVDGASQTQGLHQSFAAFCQLRDADDRPLLDESRRETVRKFISELPKTAEWRARPEVVSQLCGELFDTAAASASFREKLLVIAADCTVSCEDNVGFGLDRMRLLLRFHKAGTLPEKLTVLRQLYLQHIVMNETFRLYGGMGPNVDLLQRALKFMVYVRELGLLQDGGLAQTVHNTELPVEDLVAVATSVANASEQGFMAFVHDLGWLADDESVMDERYRGDMRSVDEWAYAALETAIDDDATNRIGIERTQRCATAMSAAVRRTLEREVPCG